MIGLVDVGIGNLGSLRAALKKLNIPFKNCKSPEDFNGVQKILLPGVGNFSSFMNVLINKKIDKMILDLAKKKYPILGICLGFQILFEESEEGKKCKGLSLLRGKLINLNKKISNQQVPHIGWNECFILKKSKLFKEIKNNSDFYFAHSYILKNFNTKEVLSKTNYHYEFVSSVSKNNLYGVQFHPEKSQLNGLKLIKNFFEEC